MLVARTQPAAVVLADGRVLVTGGFGDPCLPGAFFGCSCPPVASAELFDPASGAWTRLTPMPSARGEVSGTLLSDQSVLIAGGGGVLRFHPRSSTWTELAPAPAGCSRLLALPGDRAIAFGGGCGPGFDGSHGTAESRVSHLRFVAGDLQRSPRLVDACSAADRHQALLVLTNTAPLPGNQVLDDDQVLDPGQHCWSPAPPPATAGSLIPLQDGSVLSVQYERPPAAEVYTSAPASCTAAQVAASELFERMTPQGAAAEGTVFSKAGYRAALHPTAAGVLRVTWSVANRSPEGPARTLLARTRSVVHGNGKAVRLNLRMSLATREFASRLATYGTLEVLAEGVFRTRSGESVTVVRPFTVRSSEAPTGA